MDTDISEVSTSEVVSDTLNFIIDIVARSMYGVFQKKRFVRIRFVKFRSFQILS